MTPVVSEYTALLEQYAHGARHIEQALQHLSSDDLSAVPIPGKWSIQQVVLHLADAELAFADRIKRIVAMDNPVLLAWDEHAFTAKLHYEEQSVQDAFMLIRVIRQQVLQILQRQPASAFTRTGQHSEAGVMSLADVLRKAISHLEHHLRFVNEKREAMGKLMW